MDLGKKDLKGATATINAHILVPELEERPVPALTRKEIKAWHRELAKKDPRRRCKKDGTPANRKKVWSPLKLPITMLDPIAGYLVWCAVVRDQFYMMNLDGFVDYSRDPWANVIPFPNTDKARTRFLEIGEQLAIVKASAPTIHELD